MILHHHSVIIKRLFKNATGNIINCFFPSFFSVEGAQPAGSGSGQVR